MVDRCARSGHGRHGFQDFVDRVTQVITRRRQIARKALAKGSQPIGHGQRNFNAGQVHPAIFDQSLDLGQPAEVPR